jgi:hypothetical protein
VLSAMRRNARIICEGERRNKLQKLMRASSERVTIAKKFPLAHRVSSPISSASGIFPADPVDLFFTRMSFFS